MKKIILLVGIVCIFTYSVVSLNAQTISVSNVKERFRTISSVFSNAIFANTLTASTWNTAYRPKFFGIGLNATGSISKLQYADKLSSLDSNLVSLKEDKIPGFFGNLLLHLRFPIPFTEWPFDIGVYGAVFDLGSANTVSVDKFISIGFDARWDFLKNQKDRGLITGFTYFYQSFGIGFDIPSFEAKNRLDNIVSIEGNYKVKLDLNSHTFGFKGQYSQLFVGFIELTGGLEPYFGLTTLRIGSRGDIVVKDRQNTYSLKKYIDTYGLKTDFFSGSKISFTQDLLRGGLRMYGGFSLKLFAFFLDTGISYEPFHNTVSGSIGTRLVF